MSIAKITGSVLLLLSVLAPLGCNGPFGLLPGGALSGETASTPTDWSSMGSAGTAQLETQGAEPYSVNIAYTVIDGALYINAGDTETEWAKNIATDADVRLRIDGKIHEARADRVTDASTVDAFGDAWTNQSFFRRDPRQLEALYLYRIVRR